MHLAKNDIDAARNLLRDYLPRKRKAEEPVDETGIDPKLINRITKKCKGSTRQQAVNGLRKCDLDVERTIFQMNRTNYSHGTFDVSL